MLKSTSYRRLRKLIIGDATIELKCNQLKNIFPNVEHDVIANPESLEIYFGMGDPFSSVLKPKF